MLNEVWPTDDGEAALRPAGWGTTVGGPLTPAYVSLHGAYHVLTQRVEIDTVQHALSPSEAVVLSIARLDPRAATAVIRHATGLRRSTMTSLLERLEGRGYLRRVRDSYDHRATQLRLTTSGETASGIATVLLSDLDKELAVFVAPELLRALAAVFEASRALGAPGTAADY